MKIHKVHFILWKIPIRKIQFLKLNFNLKITIKFKLIYNKNKILRRNSMKTHI
jgi:hypothetical protein